MTANHKKHYNKLWSAEFRSPHPGQSQAEGDPVNHGVFFLEGETTGCFLKNC